jgi:acyl carrier protein
LNLPSTGPNDRLIRLVKELLGPAAVTPDPFPLEQQLSELGLSSLKMVNLMLSVEMEFDIMIPQSDITPENFLNLQSIATLVARLQARP